jgi:anti-sigma factor RsiW
VSRREDEELMAFLDGELAPRDAREVEARVAASGEARQKLDALGEMSSLVREHYREATDAAEPGMAAAWARLEAQLGTVPPEKVPARPATVPASAGFWPSILDTLVPRWTHLAAGAVGVAAGALLVIGLREPRVEVRTVIREVPPVEQPAVVAAMAEDTAVDELDIQSGTGMVFQVPTQNDKPATTVIWVTDDTPTEGPI